MLRVTCSTVGTHVSTIQALQEELEEACMECILYGDQGFENSKEKI